MASLFLPFGLSLLVVFFGTLFFSPLHLVIFSPFLALTYGRTSLLSSLWIAAGCGILIDSLSSEFHFGLYALNYTLTTVMAYPQRRHFFTYKPVGLSLYTALISFIFLLIHYTECIFSRKVFFTDQAIFSSLFLFPLVDALYAFLWFTCPLTLYNHLYKRYKRT